MTKPNYNALSQKSAAVATSFDKCVSKGDCSGARAALKTFKEVGKQAVAALRSSGQKTFAKQIAQSMKAQVAAANTQISACKIVRAKPGKKKG